MQDLLPGIIHQLGAQGIEDLKKVAASMKGDLGAGDDDIPDLADDDDVPDLVGNFDE